jgi:hypothetical protein
MSQWTPTGFFAYPSDPPSIGEIVRTACSQINQGNQIVMKTWEECRVGGKVVIYELCKEIDHAEVFCADLTGMNANVMFELGYAIAKNKRVWLTLDTSISGVRAEFEQLRILTTIGYAKYCNSLDIRSKFLHDQPFTDLTNTIFEQAIRPHLSPSVTEKLLYLKSLHDTEASIRLTSRIDRLKATDIKVIVDDPRESNVQTLSWYGEQVYSSDGVVCHMTGPQRSGARLHNARYALVAGITYGMERPLLMLTEGNFLAPIDYRDLLRHYQTASEAEGHLKSWLTGIEHQLLEKKISHVTSAKAVQLATELRGLQLGEFVAENEADSLINEYFVETAAYREALQGKHTVFVGRKGSGKTANLLKLEAQLAKNRNNLVCVIKPVGYELEGILQLFEKYKERDAKGYAIESLWKFLLYSEIANALSRKLESSPNRAVKPEEAIVLQMLKRDGGKLAGEFTVRLERCVKALLESKSRDGTVEQGRLAISEALHAGLLGELRLALGRALSGYDAVVVLIDNLDKTWDKQSDLRNLAEFLLGLLGAASRVSYDFKHRDSRRESINLSLTIFLRSDIFYKLLDVAREPDKILHSKIDWRDSELLIRVIEERFSASHQWNVPPADLWNKYFWPTVKGESTRTYFTSRILPRPRDLVFFVKAAVSTAVNRGQPLVRETDVLEAEKQYSQYALGTILVENGTTVGNLEEIVYEFVGSAASLSRQEIEHILGKGRVPTGATEAVVEHLCSLSFLGLEVQHDDFRFAEDPQEYKKNLILARKLADSEHREVRYLIHPAFRPFLEILET